MDYRVHIFVIIAIVILAIFVPSIWFLVRFLFQFVIGCFLKPILYKGQTYEEWHTRHERGE